MLKLLLIAVLCHTVVTAIEGQCPPPPVLRPCTCTSSGVETYLTCDSLKGQTYLDRVFHNTANDTFDHLEIAYSKLTSIPVRSLQTKRFATLKVYRSILTSLFTRGPGAADNDLWGVTLRTVAFEDGINWSQFGDLKQVEMIEIRDVVVPELDESFRENVSTMLKFILLKRTQTSRMDDKVFSLMPDLSDVRITENGIRELKRSIFPVTNSIETLLFDDNEIENLPEDMFKEMPRLIRVGLRNNDISRLSEAVFGQAYTHLAVLTLGENPIKCDCSIKWLVSREHHGKFVTGNCAQPLYLSGKEITDLTPAHFPHCA